MKVKMNCSFAILFALTLLFLPLSSVQADTKMIRIGASSAGGGYFVCSGAIASILDAEGMDARVQTTGGGRQNAILAHMDRVDLGLTNNIEAYEEWQKNDRKNMRSVMAIFKGVHHFVVRADSQVNDLKDLDGKAFGLTSKGSTHDVAGRQVFDILGIKPKLRNAGKTDSNNMVRDGLLVGYFFTSGIPMPFLMELESTTKLRYLSFTDEQYAKVKELAPWLSQEVMPAGSYKYLDRDIKSFGSWNVMVASKDVSDELMYNMLKAIFKNAGAVTQAYRPAKGFDKDLNSKVSNLVLPLHPGAVKFYQEQGVDVPKRLIP